MLIGSDGIASGYRFDPTDSELVGFFLHKLVVNREPIHRTKPYDTVFHAEDLFGPKEPWEIWDAYGGDRLLLRHPQLYFCCELKTVTKNGSRINRKVGRDGTWSEGPSSKVVFQNANPNPTTNPIGRRRNLRYENVDPEHPHHAAWFLDEFSMFVPHDENSKGKRNRSNVPATSRLVICRLRKSDRTPAAEDNTRNVVKERKKKPLVAKNNKKRKCSSVSQEDRPEREQMIETANKKMREDDGDQVVVGSQGGCSTSTPLPDLNNGLVFSDDGYYDGNFDVDVLALIDWDSADGFDPTVFEKSDFELDCSGLRTINDLLDHHPDEPDMEW